MQYYCHEYCNRTFFLISYYHPPTPQVKFSVPGGPETELKDTFLWLSTHLYWGEIFHRKLWMIFLRACLMWEHLTFCHIYVFLPRAPQNCWKCADLMISSFLPSAARYSSHISGFRVRSGWNEYEYNWTINLIRNLVLLHWICFGK